MANNFGNEMCMEICENKCPHCGEILTMNKRSFANHVRWCKSNPRYNDILLSTIEKQKLTRPSSVKNRIFNCGVCGKEYVVNCSDYIFNKNLFRKTCSDICSKKLTASKTDRSKTNELISKAIRQDYQNKVDKGLVKKKEILIKTCKHCNSQFETKRQDQIFCCQKCGERSRDDKFKVGEFDLKKYYNSCCRFQFSLNNYPDEFDFNLIKQHGWYKASNHGNNLNGISRDHMISRNYGYENLIDPYLISHPANCILLKHTDNFKKNSSCSISIDELIERIKIWHDKYGVYENKIDYTYFDKNNIQLLKYID